jgi:glutamine synthetase
MAKKPAAAAAPAGPSADVSRVLKMLSDNSVEYVDLRFTDPRGKWQHTAQHISTMGEDAFRDGIMFDGSSIAGWKAINESDMILMPDAASAVMDPFAAKPSMILFCDIIEPSTGQFYSRDPRATAKLCEAYVKSSGIGDSVSIGAEAEFFIFDSVKFGTGGNFGMYQVDSVEGPGSSMKDYPEGNMGHRPGVKGGYFPVPPVDGDSDLRAEMLSTMGEMGLPIEKHHHEVAQSQHELGTRFATLCAMADQMQIYKYCVHNVAHSYGKTATFMPKPIYGDNGSGMHTHFSLWKGETPLLAGNSYAGLSDLGMYAIGGLLKHAAALSAFANPTTNSYKRLVEGFEAPTKLAYSRRNRAAVIRIPIHSPNPKSRRIEYRGPDSAANPYLLFSAMLMAALDGIQGKMRPGDPLDKDIYDLQPEELANVPTVPRSLEESLDALRADHDFLLRGDVFTSDVIDTWIWYKQTHEVEALRVRPHPYEFNLYYDV